MDEKVVSHQALQGQVSRILRSDEFRSSEGLRKLLAYLTDKAATGEADHLKEYTVAIEGLGKPSSYDPQQSSTVRIQVGRLRQKLAEYARNEGKNDRYVVDLPKARFRLTCEERVPAREEDALSVTAASSVPTASTVEDPKPSRLPLGALLVGAGSVVVAALLVLALFSLFHIHLHASADVARWTPEQEALWGPFVSGKRPLIVAIEDPLFVEVNSNPGIYYRDRSMNQWKDVQSTEAVKRLSDLFKGGVIQPSRYYTAFGEAEVSFWLGKLLGGHGQSISMMRSSQLSWQQLADNNVLFVGVQDLFFDQLQGMPIPLELIPGLDGIRNTHPAEGEPALFKNEYDTAPAEQGVMYALVTHVVGPMGNNDVESFTSSRSAGYLGAVQFFANPDSTRLVVGKLREKAGGKMPQAYQVLLKVKFKDNVPTETSYVLARVLR